MGASSVSTPLWTTLSRSDSIEAPAAQLPCVKVMSLESGEAAAALTPGGETRAGSNGHGGGGGGEKGGLGGGERTIETNGKVPKAQVAVMNVEGMTCAMCVGIVENLVNRCGLP